MTVKMTKRLYGWKPELPDHRDHRFEARKVVNVAALPATVDPTRKLIAVFDQGNLGSCVGNGGSFVGHDLFAKAGTEHLPSRLELYYLARAIEGTTKRDEGCYIRNAVKAMAKSGMCAEATWPYVISKFATRPPQAAYAEGHKHKVIAYERVDNSDITNIRSALAAGFPVIFGFTVYDSFESDAVARTGTMPMPRKTEAALGGHCVVAVGYSHPKKRVICRNSWGPGWGRKGYFTMPYAFITDTNLADDFWIVRQ